MRLSGDHALNGKALLNSSTLLLGARNCPQSAALRSFSKVSEAPRPHRAIGEAVPMQTGLPSGIEQRCCEFLSLEPHHV